MSSTTLPVIAIVGRPNVGKSTFFNALTGARHALVLDTPGVTRDRHYGKGLVGPKPYIVIDTAGLTTQEEGLEEVMAEQAYQAIKEAEIVLFMVDAQAGLLPIDREIALKLRVLNKKIFLVTNKIDGVNSEVALGDFYSLGLGEPFPIAASKNRGLVKLMQMVCEHLPEAVIEPESEVPSASENESKSIKVAIVGRPNVGKSTLVNRLLGEERVIVYDQPGTTRDSLFLPIERHGKPYTLIDTAGVRRRSRIDETIEKFSVVKSLQAIEIANVVIMVLDARVGISDQDLNLLGFVLDSGRALVIAINKWDNLDADKKEAIKTELERRLQFVSFAKQYFISALHGTGVGNLYAAVDKAYESATRDLPTPMLTRLLDDALAEWQPPLVKGRRIKLRYAHAGGHNPPIIVIHGNQTDSMPEHYKRYLINYFHQALKIIGSPLRIIFKTGENPFKNKRETLSPLESYKKKRAAQKAKSDSRNPSSTRKTATKKIPTKKPASRLVSKKPTIKKIVKAKIKVKGKPSRPITKK
jgi:GTP-binding protein